MHGKWRTRGAIAEVIELRDTQVIHTMPGRNASTPTTGAAHTHHSRASIPSVFISPTLEFPGAGTTLPCGCLAAWLAIATATGANADPRDLRPERETPQRPSNCGSRPDPASP